MALTDALRPKQLPEWLGHLSLHELLGHWHRALTACLPARLRDALGPKDQRLTLVPRGDNALVCRGKGEDRTTIGEIGPSSPAGALGAMLAGAREERRRTIVELPNESIISRTVSFPAQVRRNLGQVVNYEIDRLTPFQRDQVCFDFRTLEGRSKGDKLAVEVALCRRDLIQGWLDRLRSAGAPVEEIVWEGAWPRANLLPASERPQRRTTAFTASRLLLLLVLALTAAALIGPVWQKDQILAELERDVQELKAPAEEVFELREAIERARQGSIAVLENKADERRMVDLLRELTDRLPDDTWVQNLDYRDGEVQIRGESAQAAALIGLLEQAPGFAGVAFRSPVVQVAATGKERFHVAFRYTRVEGGP